MPHHHDSYGAHKHTHLHHETNRYLQIFGITILICIVQIVGAVLSHSVSLFSDSVHAASDGLAAFTSFAVARYIHVHLVTQSKELRIRKFWMRFSGLLLLASLAWVVHEAWERYQHPAHVIGWGVMIVATIGLYGNYWQHKLIPHGTSTAQMQKRHVEGDLYSSVAVIAGGLVVWVTGWSLVDPVLSVGIAIWIGWRTIRMMWTGDDDHGHKH